MKDKAVEKLDVQILTSSEAAEAVLFRLDNLSEEEIDEMPAILMKS